MGYRLGLTGCGTCRQYRDSAMSRCSQFRPEWIKMLRLAASGEALDPEVQMNNGRRGRSLFRGIAIKVFSKGFQGFSRVFEGFKGFFNGFRLVFVVFHVFLVVSGSSEAPHDADNALHRPRGLLLDRPPRAEAAAGDEHGRQRLGRARNALFGSVLGRFSRGWLTNTREPVDFGGFSKIFEGFHES